MQAFSKVHLCELVIYLHTTKVHGTQKRKKVGIGLIAHLKTGVNSGIQICYFFRSLF